MTTTPKSEFATLVPAVLRTAVPSWWGALVAWLLALAVGRLPEEITTALAALLDSEPARALAVAVVITAWYVVWRWLEPRTPDWLVRLALGSFRTPSYAPLIDGVPQITELTHDEAQIIHDIRAIEGRAEVD